MNPIATQKGSLRVYLAAWFPVACLLATLLALSGRLSWTESVVVAFPLASEFAFICLPSWYLCRALPLRRTGFVRLFGVHTIAAFLSSTWWILTGKLYVSLLSFIPKFASLSERYNSEVPLLLGVGILLFYLAIAVNYVIGSFEVARESERLALEHEILAREAELKALRAQIDPHFLFNSLNSVSSLIATDSAGARRMCLLLADFLRKSISLGAQQNIPLVEEIALASNFLSIERVRFGSRLRVEQEIDEVSKDCLVPPLLLQPLVENAVNHGIAQLIEGGTIRIKTERRGERLRIAIDNPCDRERPQATRQGLGLQNVRSRLATLHGSESRVDVQEKDGHFRVELTLPAVVENKVPRDPQNTTGRDREPLATRRSRP